MPCSNCNENSPFQVYNNQSTYGNSCLPVECGGTLTNAKCVYYSGPALACSGVSINDSLEVALQKIDEKLCTVVGDYSTYNTYCLSPITTQKQFVESISSYVCTNKALFDTFVGTTFTAYQTTVNNRFLAIEIPGITCTFASVTSTDTLQQVLTKYCTAFSTLNTAISLTGVDWSECFTVVTPPTTIAGAFSLLVDQICQVKTSAGGTLPTFNNLGSCLPTPGSADTLISTIDKIKTRLCQTGIFDSTTLTFGCVTAQTTLQDTVQQILTRVDDYIKNKLTFSSDFSVTQTDVSNACLGKTVALTTPIIGNDKFVATSSTDTTPGYLSSKLVGTGLITITEIGTNPTKQLQIATTAIASVTHSDTYSVAITGLGTSASPLAANLKISATAGNQASLNTDGLFVSALATTYTFNSTNSITLTNVLNSITAAVRIDTSVPNLLQANANGLFVPPQPFIETPITVVSTSSLSLAVSGTSNHTLTGNVAISATLGNAISVNTDGLYVANSGITLTTTGTSGAATLTGTVLNIPNYAGGIALTALSATAPIYYNNTTGVFSITQAGTVTQGYLSNTDWNTFNNKEEVLTFSTGLLRVGNTITNTITQYTDALARAAISLTTTGTSGAATYNSTTGVLNVPIYTPSLTGYVPYTGATGNVDLGVHSYLGNTSTNTVTSSSDSAYFSCVDDSGGSLILNIHGSGVPGTIFGFTNSSVATILTSPTGVSALAIGTQNDIPLVFGTSGVERARFHFTTGNLLVGTAADNGTGAKLQVDGSITAVLASTVESNVVYYNTATGLFTYGTSSAAITASNGLTLTGSNLTLGGTLIQATLSASNTLASTGDNPFIINSLLNDNSAISLSSGVPLTGSIIDLQHNVGVNRTINISNIVTGQLTQYTPNLTAGVTLTVAQTTIRAIAVNTAMFNILATAPTTSTITHAAGMRTFLYAPNTTFYNNITNYYAVLIEDNKKYINSAAITNSYGIYQEGSTDINVFNGKVVIPNLPIYADNTAAAVLPTGQFYRTATGTVMVKY